MLSRPEFEYSIIFLNPDGTWSDSAFKAHWDAEWFWSHSEHGYVIPYEWIG